MGKKDWTPIARKSRARHGVIQLDDTDLTPAGLRTAIERGVVIRDHVGIVRFAGAPRTHEQRTLSAVWAAGRPAAASRRSAAALWKLLPDWPNLPDVCVPPPRLPRLRGVTVHRSEALVPERISVVDHIPVTNPFLTMVQLGAVVDERGVSDALERGLIRRLFTVEGMWAALDDMGRCGRNGAGVLRRVLETRALGDGRPDGLLEPRMGSLVRRAGLPMPVFQYEIVRSGVFVARSDFAYPELLIAIEVDGWETHGTPDAMRLDFERQNEIELLGWLVLRFTWDDVVRRPRYVAERIARALRAKSVA